MDRSTDQSFGSVYQTVVAVYAVSYTHLDVYKRQVLLQTYFGDVRDIYEDLIQMPFAGIGLDFIEGKQTVSLIKQFGFPQDKLLFAGLVNGKNIWKNHYEKTLQTIEDLPVAKNHIVLSTSCSLLHVPYTLQHEQKLSEEYKAYFAYAEEKLVELQELSTLAESADHTACLLYTSRTWYWIRSDPTLRICV